MFFSERKDRKHRKIPLLPLRDIIVFPYMVVPLFVGRKKSIAALDEAMRTDKDILLAAQKKAKTDAPSPDDIFPVGTIGTIIQLLRLPDGTVKVLVEGKRRARINNFIPDDDFFQCDVEEIIENNEKTVEIEALIRSIQSTFESYVKLNKRIPPEMLVSIASIDDPARLADTIVAHLSLKLSDKQEILETEDPKRRLERLYELIQSEIEILLVEKKIRSRVKKQMDKTQKEYYLNEQMQAIQKELGDRDEFKNELQELEERIKNKEVSEEARTRLEREMRKLKMMSPMSAEATVVRNYIDWVLALPWFEITEDKLDLDAAEAVLDADHYGLEKAKERILEYLAVQALVKKLRGPILCLVGPPGVGKTSLARSIARSVGRRFVRLSLGGVRDEAEIRGHRRTYIGALPGKILQSLRKAGSNNPVFLLDEVDKMSMDFRGDPSSALLEVLDPEQNNTFSDHYVDLDYDLSEVMFITTANNLHSIPLPLQDRMEIIHLSGYTEHDKVHIARHHLLDKQLKANGVMDYDVSFTDNAIRTLVNHYTREAGVRGLEREIASICRKIARKVLKQDGSKNTYKVTAKKVVSYLGPHKFRLHTAEGKDKVGVANGLAVTSVGGDILNVEVTRMPGKGKLTITGKLGDVMKEAAHAAMSYVRSRALELGLVPDFYSDVDIHIHYPEGAIPKDGPSAGITTACGLVSALTGIPLLSSVAMTGEITLRGRVLPIGGLKEKVIAAHRAGIATVIAPKENQKDLRDIPKQILKQINVCFVEHMDEVLAHALVPAAYQALLVQAREHAESHEESAQDAELVGVGTPTSSTTH
ncbi:MAG TPA: endopeptidase La [Myxococcales bacterium]|nr:endopeptidase La [Myxococcales bacterium]